MTKSLSDAEGLFVAVDVHYMDEAKSRAAMIAGRDKRFSVITTSRTEIVAVDSPYRPGEFYLREITAAGMTVADAAHLVGDMNGRFRVPDALKRADRLARGLEAPDAEPEG